jgi:hypothetical protein
LNPPFCKWAVIASFSFLELLACKVVNPLMKFYLKVSSSSAISTIQNYGQIGLLVGKNTNKERKI